MSMSKSKSTKPTTLAAELLKANKQLTRKLRKAERERDRMRAAVDGLQAAINTVPNFDEALSTARRWHYSAVRRLADEAIEVVNRDAGDKDRRECLTKFVNEATDNHGHVIYTYKAGLLLAASDNESAYEDELGEQTHDVSARACMAFRADVWEVLEARADEWEDRRDRGLPDPR